MAHAFLYMNMIEEWGSGIPKLMREMEEYGLREPEFIDMEIGFRVNLYRKQNLATSQETGQEINKTSQETNQELAETDHEKEQKGNLGRELSTSDKVCKAITENPSVTQKELQEITGLSRSGVRYILQQMRGAGRLERIGSTKNGKWVLKE